MSNLKKEFCVILWTTKDIKIENIELKRALMKDAPDADIKIVNFEDIKHMKIKGLKRLLNNYSDNSALLICSTEEDLNNLDYWKLGFVMGKISIRSKDGNKRIIGYLTENKDSVLKEIYELFEVCDNEIEMKTEINSLMRSVGIETKFDLKEFKAAHKIAKKEMNTDDFN